MAVFVEHAVHHPRPGKQEHVVAEGGRPVGNREPRPLARHEGADEQQKQSGPGGGQRQPMEPGVDHPATSSKPQ